jgi:hypothetical protein
MPRGGVRCVPGCTCRKHSPAPKASSEAERRERLRAASKRFYSANAEKRREYARRYREEHPDWVRARNDPEYKARYHLKSKYGITPEQRDELIAAQGGCCYLCDDPLVEGAIHVDHDHACCPAKSRSCGNCIRGLACQKCNQGIGQFGDDPERMRRAADRLEKANAAAIRGRSGPVRPTQEMLPFGQVA